MTQSYMKRISVFLDRTPIEGAPMKNPWQSVLLLLIVMVSPCLPCAAVVVSSDDSLVTALVDSKLSVELAPPSASRSVDTRVLLQFEHELSPQQIALVESLGVTFSRRMSSVVHVGRIYSAIVGCTESLLQLAEFGLMKAYSGSAKFFPAITSSVPLTKAPDVWENLRKDGSPIDGTGTLVAVIDTGAAWLHPSFWRVSSAETSVIQDSGWYYADLNNNSVVDTGEGPIRVVESQNPGTIESSNEYMYLDLDNDSLFDFGNGERWLAGVDSDQNGVISLPEEDVVILGESKVAVLYDQYSGSVYYRGTNLTTQALSVGDSNGHGTHVASTIAGGQIGYTAMLGMAPGADLIIIRSPLESADIIDAIHFAVQQGADVINMSFSSFLGFLDGTDVEDLAVNEAFMNNGTISVLAAGNLAGYSKHARFSTATAQTASATLSVSSPPQYSFLSILWHSYNDDEEVSLLSPGGIQINLGSIRDIVGTSQLIDEDELKAYMFADRSIRGTNRIIVQVSEADHYWFSGTWTVGLTNPAGGSVDVNMYVWDNSWSGSSLRFSSMVDNSRTMSSPATADLGIAVSSCDDGGTTISSSSGRGPRIDGVNKLSIAAPGITIRAASNSLTSLWYTRSGTSMASPHVAGLVALLKQASEDPWGWKDLSALLQGAGGSDSHYSPPDNAWGYGLCDALNSVRQMLEIHVGETLAQWAGIEPDFEDGIDPGAPAGLDIRDVRTFQLQDRLFIAVTFEGAPDFDGTNLLSLRWDLDGNNATGEEGADILAELTGGSLTIREWNGSGFGESTFGSGHWVESTTCFLWLERIPSVIRGNYSVESYSASSVLEDSSPEIVLHNQWLTLVSGLEFTGWDPDATVMLSLSDLDSPPEELSMGWAVVDGALHVLQSDIVSGTNTSVFDVSSQESEDVLSILANISDSTEQFFLPIVPLTDIVSAASFTIATLDQNVARVGLFLNDVITGQIVVKGYALLERLQVTFQREQANNLSLTLSGENGVYNFTIAAASLAAGQYEVFAVATTKNDEVLEHKFATLQIVEDNTVLVVIVLIGAVVIVTVGILPRLRAISKRGTSQ